MAQISYHSRIGGTQGTKSLMPRPGSSAVLFPLDRLAPLRPGHCVSGRPDCSPDGASHPLNRWNHRRNRLKTLVDFFGQCDPIWSNVFIGEREYHELRLDLADHLEVLIQLIVQEYLEEPVAFSQQKSTAIALHFRMKRFFKTCDSRHWFFAQSDQICQAAAWWMGGASDSRWCYPLDSRL